MHLKLHVQTVYYVTLSYLKLVRHEPVSFSMQGSHHTSLNWSSELVIILDFEVVLNLYWLCETYSVLGHWLNPLQWFLYTFLILFVMIILVKLITKRIEDQVVL